MTETAKALYDDIGHGYARARIPDPRIAARIHAALGDARSVLNVGAGTGSYEPRDRRVIALDPSPSSSRSIPMHFRGLQPTTYPR